MKKLLTRRGKIRALIALAIIFVMVFGINRINSRNFSAVQESFESIYKDRVVVNDYIFRLGLIIESKKSIINGEYIGSGYPDHSNDSVDFLLKQYAVTKFTEKEILYFDSLKKDIQAFRSLERLWSESDNTEEKAQLVSDLNRRGGKILADLTMLSQIQVSESRMLFENSNQRMYDSYLNAQLELVFLIAIGVLIPTLLFVTPLQYTLKKRLSEMN